MQLEDLVDFSTNSPLLKLLSRTTNPFVLYPAKALPTLARHIVDRPMAWATLMALPALLDLYSQSEEGAVEETDLEPDQRRGRAGYALPGATQLPFAGPQGEKVMYDVSRWTPVSSMTTGAPPGAVVSRVFPEAPGILNPGGPATEAASIALNRDPFTGRERVPDYLTPEEKRGQLVEDITEMYLPSAAGLHRQRVSTELARGNPEAAGAAALGFVGLRPRYIREGLRLQREAGALLRNIQEAKRVLRLDVMQSSSDEYTGVQVDLYNKRLEHLFARFEAEFGEVPPEALDAAELRPAPAARPSAPAMP